MASTYSPNLRLELIGTGEQQGTWGITTNTNLGTLLEEAIGGYVSVTVSDSTDTTLTTANGAADQSRNMVINLTGTLTATRNVICPAIEKLYVVKNATSGGFAVTFKVSGQTGISIPNGATFILYVDGTDARQATGSIASGGTGASTAAGAATNLGLGTGDSPQFAGVNVGNASDTTITRSSAGVIAVEGKPVVMTTGGQTVEFAVGAAATPSITSTGNTNTGMWFPTTDTIAWSTGGTERMRIRPDGNIGVGVAPRTDATINIQKAFTGATTYYGILNWAAIQSSVTSTAIYNYVSPSTAAASFTLTTLHYNYAIQGTFGAGSAVTTQYAYTADSSIIGATTNYGFYYGNTAAVTTGKTAYGFYSLANVATGGGVTWAFYGAGTANSYFGGGVGIGTTNLTGINLYILRNLTGSTFGYGIISGSVIQSDVTTAAFGVYTGLSTAAATFTLTRLSHFAAVQNALGAGSTVTTQAGFDADASLIDATTNYSFIARNTTAVTAGKSSFGFYASINTATGGGTTWAFYSAGTANSYFGGSVGIGQTSLTGYNLYVSKNITGSTTAYSISNGGTVQSDVTAAAYGYYSSVGTSAAAFSLGYIIHYAASQGTIGAGSSVSTQYGFDSGSNLIGATDNYGFFARNTAAVTAGKTAYGFYSAINIATGGGTTWGFYAAGTALNYFAGQTTVNNTLWQYAPAPTSKSTTATLTAAELKTAIINTTGTSYTVTLPLGTDIETGFTPFSTTNIGFDFHIVNTASGTITLAVNTGVTSLGTLTVATGVSAHFRLRRTAANTYVVYRLA